jgi:PLP dependent protein
MPISSPLAEVRARIKAAAQSCGRDPDTIALVAVSKTHPATRVAPLLQAGQRRFGENRVQEALEKFPALRVGYPDLRLHLIGPLQTNKAPDAVRGFDVIETLDRPRLSDAIARAAEREGRLPELLVQVNIGDEPQKAGIARGEAERFIRACRERPVRPGADRPDVHSAGKGRPPAAFQDIGGAGGRGRPVRPVDGHVGRFRDGDRGRRHGGAGRLGLVR